MEFQSVTWTRPDKSVQVPGLAIGTAGNPGVVVIQEWWGIDQEVKEHAKKLAGEGFRCVIPDLYRGKVGVEAEEAHHLMSNLDFPGAVQDIAGAADFLKGEGSTKVGVTGFCMGGALTLGAGCLVPGVSAVAPFYGVNFQLGDISSIKVPVQAHFGDKDAMKGFSDPSAVDTLEEKLKASGTSYEVFRYPTVGHAFMNTTKEGIERRSKLGQGEHNDQAAVDTAWARLIAFFEKNLA